MCLALLAMEINSLKSVTATSGVTEHGQFHTHELKPKLPFLLLRALILRVYIYPDSTVLLSLWLKSKPHLSIWHAPNLELSWWAHSRVPPLPLLWRCVWKDLESCDRGHPCWVLTNFQFRMWVGLCFQRQPWEWWRRTPNIPLVSVWQLQHWGTVSSFDQCYKSILPIFSLLASMDNLVLHLMQSCFIH